MSHRLIGVDPGVSLTNRTGLADFRDGRLVAVRAIRSKMKTVHDRAADMANQVCDHVERDPMPFDLVVEYPMVYKHGTAAKADPDDILALVLVVGGIITRLKYQSGRFPRPATWKGQVKKAIMLQRIIKRLDPRERALLYEVNDDNNAGDACGVCLWALQRL